MSLQEGIVARVEINVGLVVEQCGAVEPVSGGFETGPVDQTEDQIGLVGVPVQPVAKRAGIPLLPPSRNVREVAKRVVHSQTGVNWGVQVKTGM